MLLFYLMMYCTLQEKMIKIRKSSTAREGYFLLILAASPSRTGKSEERHTFAWRGNVYQGGWEVPNFVFASESGVSLDRDQNGPFMFRGNI
jgi:hypothetical protein